MNRILRVGDPHIKLTNLEEANRLMNYIFNVIFNENIDTIEFLGDLFHNHAVKRVEVETFWLTVFSKLSNSRLENIIVLVGNHDQIGSKEKELFNALNVFHGKWPNVHIINTPTIINNIAYAPYTKNHEKLLDDCVTLYNKGATTLLVAHQTFTGASYETGFYAEDAIEPNLIPQDKIISGHIHKGQQIGKCQYIGTPKWDTMADANSEKGIWIFDHNDDGSMISSKFISTANVVSPIYKYVIYEGQEVPELTNTARNYLEFHGKTSWITTMKKKYKEIASIKGVPTDRKTIQVSREGLYQLPEYLESYFEPIAGVTKLQINDYLKNLTEGV
ncbi:MAG TPA: metallophosphoesterase [Patescibacteria group bacterium]|nr:metallophosphoesterase [Patescibacteria group bacterium]